MDSINLAKWKHCIISNSEYAQKIITQLSKNQVDFIHKTNAIGSTILMNLPEELQSAIEQDVVEEGWFFGTTKKTFHAIAKEKLPPKLCRIVQSLFPETIKDLRRLKRPKKEERRISRAEKT
ncbi:MAG: hypothetical protein RML36_15390 [Anaerolineae bacterium]|nr:hypothetical protein [Anaerolineae bacterium]